MKLLLPAVLLALLAASAAQAQRYEFAAVGGAQSLRHAALGSIVESDAKDTDTKLTLKSTFGARITWNTRGYYGHEIGFLQSRGDLRTRVEESAGGATSSVWKQDRVKVRQAFYNFLIYFMPAGERLRPFITGGMQGSEYGAPNLAEWSHGKSRNYGANWGGGLKVKLLPHTLVRMDVRDYIGGKPYDLKFANNKLSGGLMHQWEATAGFAITF